MLKIIEDPAIIARLRKLFIRRFKPFINEKIAVKVGHQGASFSSKVAWSESLGIWMASPKEEENRYAHIFGIGHPVAGANIPIACEINIPAGGIDRRIGAAFARDLMGKFYVIHRGKIGGSQKGIGKTLFETRYRGVWTNMDEMDTAVTVAVVGELSSPRFPRQVAQFIHKVSRIKEAAGADASSQTTMPLDAQLFAEELTGDPYEENRRDLSRLCDHGLIIRDLSAALKKLGFKTGNDGHRDLFTLNREEAVLAVFQASMETDPRKTYEGVARLLMSSLGLRRSCRMILVIPAPVEATIGSGLKDLNIETLVYEWQNDQAIFPGLETLMSADKLSP
ncbi:MAG: hypothetical protein CSYNP_00714 [Syntrophus sp. SKADARSKE-3]|nr:hypothetical protein [Syntrophus sp. SKADARSKE-3]